MANPNTPNGFVFVKRLSGSTKYPEPVEFPLASSNTALAKGDVVIFTSAGAVDVAAANSTVPCGIFESVLYKNAAGDLIESTYVPASQGNGTTTLTAGAGAIVRVLVAEDAVYSVQCDSGGSIAISQTLVGNAADLLAATPVQVGPGGHSAFELDTSTASSSAAMFHIIGLDPKVGLNQSTTESSSRYGRVLVKWAENVLGQIPTASGV